MSSQFRVGRCVSNRILRASCWRVICVLVLLVTTLYRPILSQGAQTDEQAQAAAMLAEMSVAERIGQLFLVTFVGNTIGLNDPIVDLITNHHVGGVVLSAGDDNFVGPENTAVTAADLTNQLQRLALIGATTLLTETTESDVVPPTPTSVPTRIKLPLFVAVQQEGDSIPYDQILGDVTQLPSQMTIGATWKPSFAYDMGAIAGQELHSLGINMLLGPVLDVVDSPNPSNNSSLGVRSFGGDPYWVGQMGQAFVTGVAEGSQSRMAIIAKHFPGAGSGDRPLGQEAATLVRSEQQLQNFELIPFAAVTNLSDSQSTTVDGLMTTHIRYQGLSADNQSSLGPLTFDPQTLETLLSLPEIMPWRAEGGLVLSGSLGSPAVLRFYDDTGVEFPHRRIARDALLAGHDLLLVDNFALEPNDYNAHIANIKDTITWFEERYGADPVFQARVDDAVLRILQLKLSLYDEGFAEGQVIVNSDAVIGTLASEETDALVFEVAESAVSLIAANQTELPGSLGPEERIVVFTDVRVGRQCSECPAMPFIGPTAIEDKIIELYGPEGSDQIQFNRIRSYTYEELEQFLAALPEPTPSPTAPLPSPALNETPTPGSDLGTATTAPTATPSLVENIESSLASADWIIFAALDVTDEVPSSSALNQFLAERPDLVRSKNVVALAYNTPYYLDATELSQLTAFYAAFGKIDASVDASVRALFQESPLVGAPPVHLPSANYDLDTVTEPNSDQIIDLYIGQDGTLHAPAGEQPLEVVVGESLKLVTGQIIDRNGHPVPDGTMVQFLQTDRLEGFTSFISQQPTTEGVAVLDYILEARTGQFRITATSGDALNSQQVDIIIGDNVRIVVVTLTPGPTPSSTPTTQPTATSTPTPTFTPTATPTPVPISMEPSVQIAIGTFSNLFGVLTGMATIFVVSLFMGLWLHLSDFKFMVRLSLWGLIGCLLSYNYFIMQLPGSNWLTNLGNWAALVVTIVGGFVFLVVAAVLLVRNNSTFAT